MVILHTQLVKQVSKSIEELNAMIMMNLKMKTADKIISNFLMAS